MTTDFSCFGLQPALLEALQRMQYSTPTPIQHKAIPLALAGRDVLGSAQTGTGKTAAFGIPLVNKLLMTPRGTALVLTPTRELAVQVIDVISKLTAGSRALPTALIIGGESMPAQIKAIKARPRVIVGTPGRINDHLTRGSLMLHDVGFLVLDETDRMLDMGFAIQLEKIFKYLPATRQTLMFSATLPDNIVRLSAKFLRNPERISVDAVNKAATNIKQETMYVNAAEKYDVLLKQLEARTGSIIVFVKTKFGADKLTSKLLKAGHSADAIHGDLHQRRRERVIQAFRDKKSRILVATDIAARGLDIPHIEHVINYDLPQCPEDYIHRIGRTARAGAQGAAVCLIAPEDGIKWRAIHKLLNPGESPPPHHPEGKPSGNARRGGPPSFHKRPGGKPAKGGAGAKPFRFKRRNQGNAPKAAA